METKRETKSEGDVEARRETRVRRQGNRETHIEEGDFMAKRETKSEGDLETKRDTKSEGDLET